VADIHAILLLFDDLMTSYTNARPGAGLLVVPKYYRQGNTNPGSGRACAVGARGYIRASGGSFDLRDVQFFERKFTAIQADMNAMLAHLAKPHATSQQ